MWQMIFLETDGYEFIKIEDATIYALLSSGQYVNALELLPINNILDDFRKCFSDWKYNA